MEDNKASAITPESYPKQSIPTPNLSDRIIFWLIFILFLIYPICVNPFFAPAFSMPKLTFLRIVTVLILIIWLGKIVSEKRISLVPSSIYLPLLLFILVTTVSTLGSVHFLTALFGEYSRWEGFLTLLCYYILCLAALNFVREKKQFELLVIALCVSASLVSVVAIVEHFGVNILLVGSKTYCSSGYGGPNLFEVDRSFATFGNPIYLGMFLGMVFSIVATLFLRGGRFQYSKAFSILLPLTLGLVSPALFFTFARGAWLGTGLACAVAVLLSLRLVWNRKIFLVVFTAILLLGYLFTRLPSKNVKYEVSQRAASTFKLEGSNVPRLEMWKATLPLALRYAFLGSGPDTFKLVFPRYKPVGWVTTFKNPQVDRAHNEILQTTVTTGIPGLLIFIWLIITIFITGFNGFLRSKDIFHKTLLLSLVAGASSFFIQVQFNPNSLSVAPLFWILAGLIFSSSAIGKGYSFISYELPSWFKNAITQKVFYILVGVLGIILVIVSLRLYVADVYYSKALDAQYNKSLEEAETYFAHASRLNALEEQYSYSLARFYTSRALEIEFNEAYFDSAALFFDQSQRRNPLDENVYFFSGDAYLQAGRLTKKNEFFKRSIDLFREGLKLNQTSAEAYLKMGVAYAYLDQNRRAIKNWNQALDINPANPSIYVNLGLIYEEEGLKEEAERSYKSALKQNPQLKEAQKALERLKENKD